MPAKGKDFNKVKRIMKVLLDNPDGIWLRKLSRDSKIPLSTVHYYLERYLNTVKRFFILQSHGILDLQMLAGELPNFLRRQF